LEFPPASGAGPWNTALLNAAAALVDAGTELETGSIRGIALYDGDVEASQGVPQTVQDLKAVIACDGLLLATPEYNNGIPGVFKNAIDWMSRPAADIRLVFANRRRRNGCLARRLRDCACAKRLATPAAHSADTPVVLRTTRGAARR
jgi:NAD(P)H-dependent FMN reductase